MRSCDGCTLCCKLLGVVSLQKPQNVWCNHCDIGKGCTIHPMRPESCRAYSCRYLVDEALDESWKPSESGMVINAEKSRVVVYVDPETPSAWRREPYYSTLKKWAKTNEPGWPVFVNVGRQIIAVYPTHDVRVQ